MRIFTRIPWILLLLLLTGVAWSIRPISDTDILWHLRTGQWMLAHGDVIRHDIFSATRLGCDWVSVPWLYEVMLAKLHATLGWGGLTLWQVLMVAAITLQTSLLVWVLQRHTGASGSRGWRWRWPFLSIPAALAVLLTLRLLQMRINCRPELNTYLLLGAFLLILTVASRSSASSIQHPEGESCKHQPPATCHLCLLLWLLPVLQILWTNTHGAFIFGPLLVWTYASAAWLQWLVGCRTTTPQAMPLRLTAVAAMTTLACLATPYGLSGTFYPFHLFQVLTDPLYKNGIVEAHPVDLTMALDSGSLGYVLLACWVLAGLGVLGRGLEGLRKGSEALVEASKQSSVICNLGYLVSCAAMAYLSLTAIRNVPLLPLAVAPLVASGIEYAADGLAAVAARILALKIVGCRLQIFGKLKTEHGGPTRDPSAAASRGVALLHSRAAHILANALLALALLCLYRSIVSERFYNALGWRMRFAIGCSDHEHPLAACDFMAQHRPEIACRTLYGDTRSANLFLARFGPQWPVYFDGRHAEIYDPPSFRTAARTRCNPACFTNEAATYGIALACFSLTDLKEDFSPLAVALGQTNTWRLVYLDDCAALFAAATPSNAAFVARYGLPCAPTNATRQRLQFADWLTRQGRGSPAALYDPANRSLEEGALAGGLVNLLQLGGVWAPTRHIEPLCFGRLASFLDHLGWTVVADDLYQEMFRWPESFPATLPRAIRHAQAVCKATSEPAVQTELQIRIIRCARELARIDPENPVAVAALAEIATNAPALLR